MGVSQMFGRNFRRKRTASWKLELPSFLKNQTPAAGHDRQLADSKFVL